MKKDAMWPHLLMFITVIGLYVFTVVWLDYTYMFPDWFNNAIDAALFSVKISREQ